MPSGVSRRKVSNERQHHFAHGHRVFAGLDVHVRHAGRAVMDEQFGDLFVLCAVAGQVAVVAAHAAVGAVFAAEIGNFHDGAHENLLAEFLPGRGGRVFVPGTLGGTARLQFLNGGMKPHEMTSG